MRAEQPRMNTDGEEPRMDTAQDLNESHLNRYWHGSLLTADYADYTDGEPPMDTNGHE